MSAQHQKPKRSIMACIPCRERKVKCENDNNRVPCNRCLKTRRDCRYEPVADSSPLSGEPSITGAKPVYQDPSPAPSSSHWPGFYGEKWLFGEELLSTPTIYRPTTYNIQGRSHDAEVPEMPVMPEWSKLEDEYPMSEIEDGMRTTSNVVETGVQDQGHGKASHRISKYSPIVTEDDYVPFVDPTKLTMTIPLSESPSSSLPTDPSDDEI